MSDLEASNLVRAAAKRNLQRRLIERLPGIVGSRKNRKTGDEKRHVARTPFAKTHNNGAVTGCLRAFAVAQLLRDDRVTLLLQRVDRPRHIVSRQRRTVMKFCLRPQSES